jgi:hypothetical protein
MGASGKKLKGHGQRTKLTSPPVQLKDGPHGRPPHPVAARAGQVFWPRRASRRRQFRITSVLADGTIRGRRTDAAGEIVQATSARLLEVDRNGDGTRYSFIGWHPGRYETWAVIVGRDGPDGVATLLVPEWHPAWPVHVPARLLPIGVGCPGWMRAIADLSAAYPARLNIGLGGPCDDPGRDVCPAPEWPTPAPGPSTVGV